MIYKEKYLKYKSKYLTLKKMVGGAPINIMCPECKKEYNIELETSSFTCECGKIVIYPKSIDSIHKLTLEDLSNSQSMESLITTIQTEIGDDKFLIHVANNNSTVNKCKYINNSHLNADIIMNYNTDQRRPFYNHKTINYYLQSEEQTNHKPYYFCFYISNQGIKYSRVYDVLEYGASHMMMADNKEKIIIAGEIKVTNEKTEYNFESGSINYGSIIFKLINKKLISKCNNSQYMELIPFFYIYRMLADKIMSFNFTNFQYTNQQLIAELETKEIKQETFDAICDNNFDNQTTYMIKYNDAGDSYNRCRQNSLFRMNDGDGKINYVKLDADITTMGLFKQDPARFREVAEKINNEKTIGLVKTRTTEELEKKVAQTILQPIKTYNAHLFCNYKPQSQD